MILSSIIGFFMGCFIPAIASRFGKILPADPGLVLVQMWHKPCITKSKDETKNQRLKALWKKFFKVSFFFGLATAFLYMICHCLLGGASFYFACAFIYMVLLLMSVDRMYYLLPDFFTIPLLVLGFTYVYCVNAPLSMVESLIGAWYGYFVSIISVVMLSMLKKAEFGAGDAKMLTALGAWFGLIGLSVTLVLSFVFFLIEAIIYKRKVGPFGPALGSAAILVFIWLHLK